MADISTPSIGDAEEPANAEAFKELHRLFSYADDDSQQFTRWQMIAAMRHGWKVCCDALLAGTLVEKVKAMTEENTETTRES